jgi:hypothetical protein
MAGAYKANDTLRQSRQDQRKKKTKEAKFYVRISVIRGSLEW